MPEIPEISKPLTGGFLWFSRRYLRKHFHAFAANRNNLHNYDWSPDDALVVYANHASWWDPISALVLANMTFPNHRVYAPIDAEALVKYSAFSRMGFFGVERDSLRGAADFLRTSMSILEQPGSSIWLTPEGRFADPRDHAAELEVGLAHLASRLSRSTASRRRTLFVPVATEYMFWEERKPEALAWFGTPIHVVEAGDGQTGHESLDKAGWNRLLTQRLRDAQASLASASIARDSSQFEVLLGSQSGTFAPYDLWRRFRSRLTGRSLSVDHSDKLSNGR